MIKTVTVLRRRPDLTPEEFHRHWQEVHGPLVLKLPGVRGYVQGRPLPGGTAPGCDGIAEVWYDDIAARDAAIASPEYAEVLADEDNFLGATTGESLFVTVAEDRLG